jgi:hypothetical protein
MKLRQSRIYPGLIAIVCALLCCSCDELNPQRPKPFAVVWKPIGSWSGRGSSQTDTFEMGMATWRVRWKASNQTPGAKGKFTLTVNSTVSGRSLTQLVDHEGPGDGIGYVNDDPRPNYLVVDSNDLDWTVTVEQSINTGGPAAR